MLPPSTSIAPAEMFNVVRYNSSGMTYKFNHEISKKKYRLGQGLSHSIIINGRIST